MNIIQLICVVMTLLLDNLNEKRVTPGEKTIEVLVIMVKSIVCPIHELFVANILIANVPAIHNWYPLSLKMYFPKCIPLCKIYITQIQFEGQSDKQDASLFNLILKDDSQKIQKASTI